MGLPRMLPQPATMSWMTQTRREEVDLQCLVHALNPTTNPPRDRKYPNPNAPTLARTCRWCSRETRTLSLVSPAAVSLYRLLFHRLQPLAARQQQDSPCTSVVQRSKENEAQCQDANRLPVIARLLAIGIDECLLQISKVTAKDQRICAYFVMMPSIEWQIKTIGFSVAPSICRYQYRTLLTEIGARLSLISLEMYSKFLYHYSIHVTSENGPLTFLLLLYPLGKNAGASWLCLSYVRSNFNIALACAHFSETAWGACLE